MNNSVIVVEHDEQMMREADWIIDIGPKAGRLGGKVLFSGKPEDLLKTDTLTAQYLKGDVGIPEYRDTGMPQKEFITLSGCTGNNLKNVTVKIPLGRMVCVTGVSGSGKSSLINQTLYPILSQYFYRSKKQPLPYGRIEGLRLIDKVINVDQAPIGRTPRSNPATYTNVFNDIRDLFAQMPESRNAPAPHLVTFAPPVADVILVTPLKRSAANAVTVAGTSTVAGVVPVRPVSTPFSSITSS
jgi:excinuclease ABC subunit A